MKYTALLIFIVMVATLLSGCTDYGYNFGPIQWNIDLFKGSGNGVDIVSFTTETPTLSPGEEGTFEVKIKNTGSVKATNGFVELLGLDYTWSSSGEEILPNEEKCRHTVRQITLLPKDENTGAQGGEFVCTWNYMAPDTLPIGESTYEPTVRVFYTYETTSVGSVTLVPKEELTNFMEKGGTLKSDVVSQTKSPIKMTLKTRGPVKLVGGKSEFPIEITIENVGGGTVCPDVGKCKRDGGNIWDQLIIDMELPDGLENKDCDFVGKATQISMGKSQILKCNLEITGSVNSVTQKYIRLHSIYGYFNDAKMTIRVKAGV
ncbi:MAG: hypothetical protein JW716_03160 [Candidatus Aenigmarchaeota archaeon]|nr:hypothetical protein [Candidatus Aenigmarchaeota archaeon]